MLGLRAHRDLMARRELIIPIHTITFAPQVVAAPQAQEGDLRVASTVNLLAEIKAVLAEGNEERFLRVPSALQSISSIRSSKTEPNRREDQFARGSTQGLGRFDRSPR